MTMFLWGALTVLALGAVLGLVLDEDVREAAVTLGWAMLFGPPLMLVLGFAWLLRLLPTRLQPRRVRGRRLSARALKRVAETALYDGWMVATPVTSIVVIKRKR